MVRKSLTEREDFAEFDLKVPLSDNFDSAFPLAASVDLRVGLFCTPLCAAEVGTGFGFLIELVNVLFGTEFGFEVDLGDGFLEASP